MCVLCDVGMENVVGDDVSGKDMICDIVFCEENYCVFGGACVSCESGESNEVGDYMFGVDIMCEVIFCGVN